jgi:hypothetical protein
MRGSVIGAPLDHIDDEYQCVTSVPDCLAHERGLLAGEDALVAP